MQNVAKSQNVFSIWPHFTKKMNDPTQLKIFGHIICILFQFPKLETLMLSAAHRFGRVKIED